MDYSLQTPHVRECLAEECDREARNCGLCAKHYQQVRRIGRLTPERERKYGRTRCSYPSCFEQHSARDYCKRHYMSEYHHKIVVTGKDISNVAGGG